MTWFWTLLISTTLAAGCASAGTSIPADSLPPCASAAGHESWRQASGDGVSFCVPADWASAGRRGWRGPGGKFQWDRGEHEARREISSAVVAVTGDRAVAPPIPAPIPAMVLHRSTEEIGGALVELWISEMNGALRTGADWKSGRAIHMRGEALSRSAAELQLEIYRTTRVAPR